MEYTIFHNPRCRKSRETLELLADNGITPNIRLYLKEIPSKQEITEVLKKLGIEAIKLVRKSESLYKEHFKANEYSNEQWINILHEHPKLIERPIVIRGNEAIIGRPPTTVLEIIK